MKKKIFLSLFFIISFLIFTGCNNKKNIVNIDVTSEKLNKIAEYKYDTTFKCDGLKKTIKYFNFGYNNYWFVTEDNDVYVYDISQLFSNDTNCKKLDEKFDNIILKNHDFDRWNGEKYAGNDVYYNSKFKKVSVDLDTYSIIRKNVSQRTYSELLADLAAIKDSDYKKITKPNSCTAFGIKNDNKIYMFKIISDVNYRPIDKSIISEEEVVFSVPEDEIILDFYYSSNAYANHCYRGPQYGKIEEDIDLKFIITDKAYYRPMLVDESCNKYIDVECRYEWRKDEDLSKIKDEILYRDSSTLITKTGRVYYNSNYAMDD